MISLLAVQARLANKPAGFGLQWFRKVEGAGAYANLRRDNLPKPACWIVRAADNAKPAGERRADTRQAFDVVIALDNAVERSPMENDELLLTYRRAVAIALVGFRVPGADGDIVWDGGAVLEYGQGDLFWRDRYSFPASMTFYLSDPPPFEAVQPGEANEL